MVPIIDAALGVVKGGMDLFGNWQKKKLQKQESQLRVVEALTTSKIKTAENQQVHDFAWEDTAQRLSGWKDELMMAIILIPMVACFIPGGAEWVKTGFAAMKAALPPMWWAAFWAIFGSAYGLKKFCDFKSVKSGVDLTKLNGWNNPKVWSGGEQIFIKGDARTLEHRSEVTDAYPEILDEAKEE